MSQTVDVQTTNHQQSDAAWQESNHSLSDKETSEKPRLNKLMLILLSAFCLFAGMLGFFLKGPGILFSLIVLSISLVVYFSIRVIRLLWQSAPSSIALSKKWKGSTKAVEPMDSDEEPELQDPRETHPDYLRLKQILVELQQDYEEGKISEPEYHEQSKQIRAQAVQLLYSFDQLAHTKAKETEKMELPKDE